MDLHSPNVDRCLARAGLDIKSATDETRKLAIGCLEEHGDYYAPAWLRLLLRADHET